MYANYEAIRKARGLSDYAVSKKSGVPATVISNWKTGRSTPKLPAMIKMAEVLECDVMEFVDEKELH